MANSIPMDPEHPRNPSDETIHPAAMPGSSGVGEGTPQEAAIQPGSSVVSDTSIPTPTNAHFRGTSNQSAGSNSVSMSAQGPGSAYGSQIGPKDATPNKVARTQTAQSTNAASNNPPPSQPGSTFNQAALGRGRAPTLQSQASFATNSSPNSRASVTLPPMTARPPGQGHRSMPSTSASLTFSDAPTSGNYGGNGNQTETESVFSAEDNDTGTMGYGTGGGLGQQNVRRSRIPLEMRPSHTGSRIGRSGPGALRLTSAANDKGKNRLRSTSRAPATSDSSSADEDENGNQRKSVGEDSVNVLPVGMKPAAAASADMDDDEFKRRDRGEELVRRRMRERKKEKKEAERRERKRKEEETRRGRERQTARSQKNTGIPPLTARESVMSDLPLATGASYEDRPTFSRRSTDPTALDKVSQSSSFSRPGNMSREPSGATAIPAGGPYSPTSSQQHNFWPPPPTSSTLLSATPTPASPFFPQGAGHMGAQARAVSYAPSNASRRGETDVFDEAEQEEGFDRVPELQSREGSVAWREDVARSMRDGEAPGVQDVEEEAEEEEEDDDDDDDDGSNDGVEYTLKDRQDAINIEHPFGLPIWKPALYKKHRSVTRHADADLHLAPSAAAEHHYLPGNFLWALLFGWWMALVCIIFAGILCIVPFGGAKYGRVIWELAGYLFWPFGKYVEKYEEGDSEEIVKGYDELSEDGDETVYDDPDRTRDIEDAGKTWGRRSGRSTGSVGTVRNVASRPELIDALEGREPTSAPATVSRESGTSTPTPSKYKRSVSYASGLAPEHERSRLLGGRSQSSAALYGTVEENKPFQHTSSGSETEVAEGSPLYGKKALGEDDESKQSFRVRALGRLAYWTVFYLLVAPMMLFVCLLCWGLVFTIPMAKLLWILVCNLGKEPLALHFRSPSPNYHGNNSEPGNGANGSGMPHLEAGQRAPRHSRSTYESARAMGRLLGPNSTIILCTSKALGLKYYKYTVDGINIIFINLLPLIAFVIFDFFFIARMVEKHHLGGFLAFISSQATMFILALLSVIPLSYFIGMAVASISAQSSIGMGAVINATFGSIIEIILYSIALTQAKGKLVEGSIVGSLLAGVLLMPGLSMIGGAVRRKEQRFNARSAGVTSTMMIMAIIGILTPTLFYEIYGTFQLTCSSCPEDKDNTPDGFSCRRCQYEHVDPVDDDFYQSNVKGLGYYCAVILVLSYLIGLWFSLRTHASQIWQNQHAPPPSVPQTATGMGHQMSGSHGLPSSRIELPHRSSMYKRLPQAVSNLLPTHRQSFMGSHAGDASFSSHTKLGSTPHPTPDHASARKGSSGSTLDQQSAAQPLSMQLPPGVTAEEVNRAFHLVAATASVFHSQQNLSKDQQLHPGLPHSYSAAGNLTAEQMSTPNATLRRQGSHVHERDISRGGQGEVAEDSGHGGHDAPNWSRQKSYSVLFGCTALYAIISEILVDVVDVVLDGSCIPEKFLGITLFALVPNVTEFMNAISFAMNGNIALSMEIGSAYAIQVCMIQIPAMIAFTFFYGIGKDSMLHRAFSLVFPRWDAISIMFSVFLLTYTYIEARSNYYRGSILVLSYMVLLGGFYMAPGDRDTSDNPLFTADNVSNASLSLFEYVSAVYRTLFSH